MNAMAQLAPNVIIIPATKVADSNKKKKKLRVAAYCRVSTDEEDQLLSYESQVKHYTAEIEKNPTWKNAGIFADEGITGVSTKKRDHFNDMIDLCRAGKIDRIITKSISRFARNTVDSLQYIRELKALGISVYFEKENIDTLNMDNETILTVYSAFAQAESESISGNVRLGKRIKFKAGEAPMMYGNLLGYRKGADGNPEIIPEEAIIIRFIYDKFLEGNGYSKICDLLKEKGYKTKKGKTEWSVSAVRTILTNEKYKGDVIMQKTFVVDLFSKKTARNNGDLPMYLVKDHHIPIIEPATFDKVQIEIAKRNSLKAMTDKGITPNSRFSGKYALTGLVECGNCGSKYRRTTWSKRGKKKVVWRCVSRLEYGTKYCNDSSTIEEERLHNGILKAMNMMQKNAEEIRTLLYGTIAEVLASSNTDKEMLEIKNKIDMLNKEMMQYIEDEVSKRTARDEIEAHCKEKSTEIQILQDRLNTLNAKHQMENLNRNYLTEIYEHIAKIPGEIKEYNDTLARLSVTNVKILSEEKLEVTLYGTVTLTVDM